MIKYKISFKFICVLIIWGFIGLDMAQASGGELLVVQNQFPGKNCLSPSLPIDNNIFSDYFQKAVDALNPDDSYTQNTLPEYKELVEMGAAIENIRIMLNIIDSFENNILKRDLNASEQVLISKLILKKGINVLPKVLRQIAKKDHQQENSRRGIIEMFFRQKKIIENFIVKENKLKKFNNEIKESIKQIRKMDKGAEIIYKKFFQNLALDTLSHSLRNLLKKELPKIKEESGNQEPGKLDKKTLVKAESTVKNIFEFSDLFIEDDTWEQTDPKNTVAQIFRRKIDDKYVLVTGADSAACIYEIKKKMSGRISLVNRQILPLLTSGLYSKIVFEKKKTDIFKEQVRSSFFSVENISSPSVLVLDSNGINISLIPMGELPFKQQIAVQQILSVNSPQEADKFNEMLRQASIDYIFGKNDHIKELSGMIDEVDEILGKLDIVRAEIKKEKLFAAEIITEIKQKVKLTEKELNVLSELEINFSNIIGFLAELELNKLAEIKLNLKWLKNIFYSTGIIIAFAGAAITLTLLHPKNSYAFGEIYLINLLFLMVVSILILINKITDKIFIGNKGKTTTDILKILDSAQEKYAKFNSKLKKNINKINDFFGTTQKKYENFETENIVPDVDGSAALKLPEEYLNPVTKTRIGKIIYNIFREIEQEEVNLNEAEQDSLEKILTNINNKTFQDLNNFTAYLKQLKTDRVNRKNALNKYFSWFLSRKEKKILFHDIKVLTEKINDLNSRIQEEFEYSINPPKFRDNYPQPKQQPRSAKQNITAELLKKDQVQDHKGISVYREIKTTLTKFVESTYFSVKQLERQGGRFYNNLKPQLEKKLNKFFDLAEENWAKEKIIDFKDLKVGDIYFFDQKQVLTTGDIYSFDRKKCLFLGAYDKKIFFLALYVQEKENNTSEAIEKKFVVFEAMQHEIIEAVRLGQYSVSRFILPEKTQTKENLQIVKTADINPIKKQAPVSLGLNAVEIAI
ncbi:MAG: hypothetical protein ABIG64_01240 [Candidatus Omnitrophota bacterium]